MDSQKVQDGHLPLCLNILIVKGKNVLRSEAKLKKTEMLCKKTQKKKKQEHFQNNVPQDII